jgi:acyl transferase domain-containing protein
LGTRSQSALPATRFDSELSLGKAPWLADHRVRSAIVMPAAGYLELALAALHESGQENGALEDVTFQEVMLVRPQGVRAIRVVLGTQFSGKRTFQIFSGPTTGDGLGTLHAQGVICSDSTPRSVERRCDLEQVRGRCPAGQVAADFYAEFARRGLNYGPCFQAVSQVWAGAGEALGRLQAPSAVAGELGVCQLHPALLDGAFQVLGAVLRDHAAAGGDLYLPIGLTSLRLHRAPRGSLWVHAIVRDIDDSGAVTVIQGDITLLDEQGRLVAEAKGLRLRQMGRPRVTTPSTSLPRPNRVVLEQAHAREVPPDSAPAMAN